jgi:hypothetical protein
MPKVDPNLNKRQQELAIYYQKDKEDFENIRKYVDKLDANWVEPESAAKQREIAAAEARKNPEPDFNPFE